MRKILCTILVVLCVLSMSSLMLSVEASENNGILVVTFNYGYESDPGSDNVEEALVEAGYTVAALYNPAPGVIASTLATHDCNQIYLFDLTSTLGLVDTEDKAALVTWYSNHRGNIVIDGRSFGIYYEYEKDKKLIENIAHAFSLRSGGLWIGVDARIPGGLDWPNNGNALLSAIGYGTVTGVYYSAITGGDTSSELLSDPNAIIPSTLWAEAGVSSTPTGAQPDGVNLKPLIWSESTTYASYALQQYMHRTIDELKTKIEEIGSQGEIDNRGMVKSLLAKLNVAQRLVDKGKTDQARDILNAFVSEVQAQSGKHITAEAADVLIESAEYILAHL